MRAALVTSQALDAGTFALAALLLPSVLLYEVNPLVVGLVSVVGVAGFVAVKVGIGLFAAYALGRVGRPARWLRGLIVVGILVTLAGAVSNLVVVAQVARL
jgi:hypothetical protein